MAGKSATAPLGPSFCLPLDIHAVLCNSAARENNGRVKL